MNIKPDLTVILDLIQALRQLDKDNKLSMVHVHGATKLNFQINLNDHVWAQIWRQGDGTIRYDLNNLKANLYIGGCSVTDTTLSAEAIYTFLTTEIA